MAHRLPPIPNILKSEVVELAQVGSKPGTIRVDQFAELLDSPTALEYRLNKAENTS